MNWTGSREQNSRWDSPVVDHCPDQFPSLISIPIAWLMSPFHLITLVSSSNYPTHSPNNCFSIEFRPLTKISQFNGCLLVYQSPEWKQNQNKCIERKKGGRRKSRRFVFFRFFLSKRQNNWNDTTAEMLSSSGPYVFGPGHEVMRCDASRHWTHFFGIKHETLRQGNFVVYF